MHVDRFSVRESKEISYFEPEKECKRPDDAAPPPSHIDGDWPAHVPNLALMLAATSVAAPKNPDELAEIMTNHPSTEGWDVICSYNEVKLNEILQRQFERIDAVKQVILGGVDDPYHISYIHSHYPLPSGGHLYTVGMYVSESYAFDLKIPVLQFNENGNALLTMEVKSAKKAVQNLSLVRLPDDEQEMEPGLKGNTWYQKDPQGKFSEINLSDLSKARENENNDVYENIYRKVSDESLETEEGEYNNKWYRLSSLEVAVHQVEGHYQFQAVVPLAGQVTGDQTRNFLPSNQEEELSLISSTVQGLLKHLKF